MRRTPFLALVGAAILGSSLAACGGTSADHTTAPIVFGVAGGNVIGYHVTIQPDGSVHGSGSAHVLRRQIAPPQLRELRDEITHARLVSRSCPGALPDLARRYIRAGNRTITVHGDCEAGFERVWSDLTRAVAAPR